MKIFNLKRPFEANKGDAEGHFGHHKNKSCHIKIPSAPQISKYHIPLALHLSSHSAIEIVKNLGLEAK